MNELSRIIEDNWGIPHTAGINEISDNVWEVGGEYILKKRGIGQEGIAEDEARHARSLTAAGIPAAAVINTLGGAGYAMHGGIYQLFKKLRGKCLTDFYGRGGKERARLLGAAVADMHLRLRDCNVPAETFDEAQTFTMKSAMAAVPMRLREAAIKYQKEYMRLAQALPSQIIHGDAHAGNFLFCGDKLTGCIDWDHIRHSRRVYDIAYGLRAILFDAGFDEEKIALWQGIRHAYISGYSSVLDICQKQIDAALYLGYGVEMGFISYFVDAGQNDYADGSIKMLPVWKAVIGGAQ